MRQYASELEAKGFRVQYEKLAKGSIFAKLKKHAQKNKTEEIHYFSIDDTYCREEFTSIMQGFELTEHTSPKFLGTRHDFKTYLDQSKKPFMKTFYEKSRKRLDFLMENGKPVGGKYSFDQENRNKLPKTVTIPTRKKTP